MALPSSYLTSVKNWPAFMDAIRSAQAPDKFTLSFLESLDFTSSSDRLFIGTLKMLGFLDDAGRPTERYFRYLDKSQSDAVMAEGIREAYQDLFRVNINAHTMSRQDLVNKLKTLTQGKVGESVLDKMAMTFAALVKQADFNAPPAALRAEPDATDDAEDLEETEGDAVPPVRRKPSGQGLALSGLVYNIQIVLPESRDPAVYDALFQSLRKHLA
ncbi:MAG: DUF5343 domain-containing protein [Gemmatimonadales bacterium]|nr:DUF5343 domain-containing protein [Gemmatimonadales bacterium]